jgi:hypothetical protein
MKKYIKLFFVFFLFGNTIFSQISNLGDPLLFNSKIEKTKLFYQTPVVDNFSEIQHEKKRQINSRDKVYRFGKEHQVSINIFEKAEKTVLANGDLLYQFGIECKNAISINVQFDKFDLAVGVRLYLVDPIQKKMDGAYTHFNNNPSKMLGSELVYSDKVILEVFVPKEKEGASTLNLSTIVHGYRNLDDMAKALNSSGSCEIDVNCPLGLGWENQRNSVAMIVNGGGFCTGSLVNNTSGEIIPYFLSANHCGTSPGAWVFRFRYESPAGQADCGTSAPSVDGPTNMNINGATLCAANAASDFTLSLLNQKPDPAWGVYYNGWDRTNIPATELTCIHHPLGDVKKISKDYSTAQSSSFNSAGSPDSHWQVPSWDHGVTEPASSGSPLFNQDHRTIGQLHGGNSGCGFPSSEQNDDYGKFFLSWTGGGTNSTRLSNWLDPGNIGPNFIDGVDPAIPNHKVDGGISNAQIKKSTLCGGILSPELSIYNSGVDTIFSAIIHYNFNGIKDLTYNFKDTLITNQTKTIVLPNITLDSGNHVFNAYLTNTTSTDENPHNDTINKTFTTITNGEILTLNMNIFCYLDENRWEVLDPVQTIVASGGPYSGPNPIIDSFCVSTNCYTFKLYDSGNDGIKGDNNCLDGFYSITNSDGTIVSQLLPKDANFGNLYTSPFCNALKEISNDNTIKIYPNPTQSTFTIHSNKIINRIELATITGQIIYQNNEITTVSSIIDVSNFAKGIYLIRIESESEILVKSLFVE